MRTQLDPRDYLPVTTIKSYFSRSAAKKKKRKVLIVIMMMGKWTCLIQLEKKSLKRKEQYWIKKSVWLLVELISKKKNGLQLLTQENGFQHSSFNSTQSRTKHKSTFWKDQHQMSIGLCGLNCVVRNLILHG